MQIDDMRVAIRPMNTAQAVDLGFMMARHWFLPLWFIWLGMATPIFLIYLLSIILGIHYNFLIYYIAGSFLFWWLKPIYEKPLVEWLGQALFGIKINTIDSIKKGWKTSFQHSGKLLFKKRISTNRQLVMPILLLENPDREQFNLRQRILRRGQGSSVSWHTIIMMHIELLISVALLSLMYGLIPHNLISSDLLIYYLEHSSILFNVLWACIYFLSVSLVAPFFICSGFSIYLTKRCLLEGWDIELVFRRLSQRYIEASKDPLNRIQNK